MMQSVLGLISFFLLGVPVHADSSVTAVVSVKLPGDLKLTDEDIFVAWVDDCRSSVKDVKSPVIVEEKFIFSPRALVAKEGQTLRIVNKDQVQHNSFALKTLAFDSGLQKPGSSHGVKLAKPGVTKIFCRIHPKMSAEVLVLKKSSCHRVGNATELAEKKLVISNSGVGKVWLWSPRLKKFHSQAQSAGSVEFKLAKSDFLETVATPASGPSGDIY